jgi:hypothetical protein
MVPGFILGVVTGLGVVEPVFREFVLRAYSYDGGV